MLVRTNPQTEVAQGDLLSAHNTDIAEIEEWSCRQFAHRKFKGIKNGESRTGAVATVLH